MLTIDLVVLTVDCAVLTIDLVVLTVDCAVLTIDLVVLTVDSVVSRTVSCIWKPSPHPLALIINLHQPDHNKIHQRHARRRRLGWP